MQQSLELLYPMGTMVGWTFLILLRNVHVRVRSVLRGELTNQYFELFSGAEPSDIVVKTGNHLRNLFEFPLLFYVAVLTAISIDQSDRGFLILAWSYVALRVAHSLVHLTINKVPPRFFFYILSNIVLLIMWIQLIIRL